MNQLFAFLPCHLRRSQPSYCWQECRTQYVQSRGRYPHSDNQGLEELEGGYYCRHTLDVES
jgi:hypothetical protein